MKNLILNYKFFYNQIYLIFCFVDETYLIFFFIKALNSFLFLSLIKKNVKWLIQIARLLENYIFSKLILAQLF